MNSILLGDSLNNINFSKDLTLNQHSKSKNGTKIPLIKCRNIGLSKNNSTTSQEFQKRSKKRSPTSTIGGNHSNSDESSVITTQQLNKLESWGLPPAILTRYEERGVKEMFQWQVECLSNIKVLNNYTNLVYSAPTSAGKTLVAEILAIKTVLERQRKVLIILPFVSVVREKMFYFQDILGSSGVRVEGFMGSYNPPGGFTTVQVAVCTIEKANNIVNRLLEDNCIDDIGAVIIDELHLLGDPSRGYLLELLLTKLLYISKKKPEFKIQLIGMSATLPNLSILSTWLNAELYKTDFRPIPLFEQCYINGTLCNTNFEIIRKIEPNIDIPKDMDNIIQFCLETIYCSCSVLIFCSAKNWCETLAQQISSTFRLLGRSESPLGTCLRDQLKTESIMELLEQLKRCPVGLDSILKTTVSFGVAFHHAGLTMDERDIIEGAFRNGALRVLIATSTLSAGVNLPARRVIIRSPMFAGKPMDTLTYRQMIGRAGRMGKDTAGESILICQKNEKYAATQLLSGKLKPIVSCLEGSGRLKRAILEVIASGVAITPEDIKLFTECTLLASSDQLDELENPIEDTVDFLLRNEFVRLQKNAKNQMQYVATSLAKACLSSSMPPEEGLTLFAELEKARQCFVLESELHIIYLVTPYSACNQWGTIDWIFFHSLWEMLSQADRRVGELIGISESYLARAMSGRVASNSQHRLHTHRRFYVALALRELVEEVPLGNVADKYKCNRGLLQSLQQSASTFAGMVTAFSKQLGWSSVELLVAQFQDRLQFGVNRELLDLMRMPSLNGICARLLFNAGIETIVMLAATDVCTLENVLTRAVPFESEKGRDGETTFDQEKRKKIKTIWISGKNGLTEREASEILITEARNFLKYEMGLADAKWDTEVTCNPIEIEDNPKHDTSAKLYVTLNSILESSATKTNAEIDSSASKINEKNLKFDVDLADAKWDSEMTSNPSEIENNPKHDTSSKLNVTLNSILESSAIKTNAEIDSSALKIINEKNTNSEEMFETENDLNICVAEIIDSETPSFVTKISPVSETTREKIYIGGAIEPETSPILNKVEICAEEFAKASDYYIMENNFQSNMELNISMDLKTSKSYCWPTMDGQISDLENKLNPKGNLLNNTNQSGSLFEESMLIDSNICKILDNKVENCTSQVNTSNLLDAKLLKNSFLEQAFNSTFPNIENVSKEMSEDDDIVLNSNDESMGTPLRSKLFERTGKSLSKLHENTKKKLLLINKTKVDVKKLNKRQLKTISPIQQKRDKIETIRTRRSRSKWDKIEIIDVCKNKKLFETITKKLLSKKMLSISIACEKFVNTKLEIGKRIIKYRSGLRTQKSVNKFVINDRQLIGFSIYGENNIVYYFSLVPNDFVPDVQVLDFFQKLFTRDNLTVCQFNVKEQLKLLLQIKFNNIYCKFLDPKIIEWLFDPESRVKTFYKMVGCYRPELKELAKSAGKNKYQESLSLNIESSISGRLRSATEALITWYIIESQQIKITEQDWDMDKTLEVEMGTITCLANMEVVGFGVNTERLDQILSLVQDKMAEIETECYCLVGRHFSLSSSTEVAKVLKLAKTRKVSTNKQVLEKIENPIAALVIIWRKLNSILTKILFPVLRVVESSRIYCCSDCFNATGRITMYEPSLQSIPRDFDVTIHDTTMMLSVRSAFVPKDGYVLISADYCQLELRLLAHLSQDQKLCAIMHSDQDVFRLIAAKWYKMPISEVDDTIRHRAKQLCYGIIYGMGVKTLGDQLELDEHQASEFIESFKNTYPKIRDFIESTVGKCRKLGYVETLYGRRRYLENINKSNSLKSQAERQAVNTTIQGSAADIAKTAMVNIDKTLQTRYKTGNVAHLVLHLHDELIYETQVSELNSVMVIIKNCMEQAVNLSVPFPVQVKFGYSWGELEVIDNVTEQQNLDSATNFERTCLFAFVLQMCTQSFSRIIIMNERNN